jgi:hypothetical protein
MPSRSTVPGSSTSIRTPARHQRDQQQLDPGDASSASGNRPAAERARYGCDHQGGQHHAEKLDPGHGHRVRQQPRKGIVPLTGSGDHQHRQRAQHARQDHRHRQRHPARHHRQVQRASWRIAASGSRSVRTASSPRSPEFHAFLRQCAQSRAPYHEKAQPGHQPVSASAPRRGRSAPRPAPPAASPGATASSAQNSASRESSATARQGVSRDRNATSEATA